MNKRFSLFLLTALCAFAPVANKAAAEVASLAIDTMQAAVTDIVTDRGYNLVDKIASTFLVTFYSGLIGANLTVHWNYSKKKAAAVIAPALTAGAVTYLYMNNPEAFKAAVVQGASVAAHAAKNAGQVALTYAQNAGDIALVTAHTAGQIAFVNAQHAHQALLAGAAKIASELPSKEVVGAVAYECAQASAEKVATVANQVITYAQPKVSLAFNQAVTYAHPYVMRAVEAGSVALNQAVTYAQPKVSLAFNQAVTYAQPYIEHAVNIAVDYAIPPVIDTAVNTLTV